MNGMTSIAQSSNPYQNGAVEMDHMIDPDDTTLGDPNDSFQSFPDTAPFARNEQSQATSSRAARNYLTSSMPGEDRRVSSNTIDETVWETLSRDLLAICEKVNKVLWPRYLLGGMLQRGGDIATEEQGDAAQAGTLSELVGLWPDTDAVLRGTMNDGLRNWDLWGPLIFCLLLSFFLSRPARDEQKSLVFSGVFATVWIGEAMVTLQIKLLGGNISFLQSICIIGYTLFPLVIASILSAFGVRMVIRTPVYIALVAWSLAAGISILGGSGVIRNRVSIAVYPLFVFYVSLGCLCFIS